MAVSFPGLGLELELNKIAFTVFNISVHWYAIIMVLAIIAAIIVCRIKNNTYGIKFENILDLLIYIIPIGFISARLYYVIFNLNYYIQNPIQIINFRNGGIAIYGGIIGGIITAYVFCKKRKINFLDLLDYISPCLALAQCIGRWGNFINIEAYGKDTNLLWRMGIIENGIYKEVHPAFLYEAISTFLIFIILMILQNKRKFRGQITYIYLILYSFARFFIENIRIDSLMLFNFRISQILSIIIFVVFCSIIIYKVRTTRKNSQKIKK